MADQCYSFGGKNWTYGSCSVLHYMYDLSGNTWTGKTSLVYMRSSGANSAAGAEVDGYAFGGQTGGETPYGWKKVEKYNILGNSWTTKLDQPLNDGGNGHRPDPISGYIFAGTWKYNFVNDSWKAWVGCNPNTDFGLDGIIYGGSSSASNNWKYDPSTDSKTLIASCTDNHDSGAVWDDDTNGFEQGGGGQNPPKSTCHRYNIAGNTWTARTGSSARSNPGSAMISDGVDKLGHKWGGYVYPNVSYNDHYRFDDAANSWIGKAGYPQSYAGMCGYAVPANFAPNAPTGISAAAT